MLVGQDFWISPVQPLLGAGPTLEPFFCCQVPEDYFLPWKRGEWDDIPAVRLRVQPLHSIIYMSFFIQATDHIDPGSHTDRISSLHRLSHRTHAFPLWLHQSHALHCWDYPFICAPSKYIQVEPCSYCTMAIAGLLHGRPFQPAIVQAIVDKHPIHTIPHKLIPEISSCHKKEAPWKDSREKYQLHEGWKLLLRSRVLISPWAILTRCKMSREDHCSLYQFAVFDSSSAQICWAYRMQLSPSKSAPTLEQNHGNTGWKEPLGISCLNSHLKWDYHQHWIREAMVLSCL